MINRLRGIVVESFDQSLTLDVQGVCYEVAVADARLYKLQDIVEVLIYYHWTSEHGPHLFGFDSALSKTVFSQIISCSGCGPKIGLAVLSHMAPAEFIRAISQSDSKALSAVSGIGQKKAELMIAQLKDKVSKIIPDMPVADHKVLLKIKQLTAALTALHYRPAEIASALEHVHQKSSLEDAPFEELIRTSLSHLAKRL